MILNKIFISMILSSVTYSFFSGSYEKVIEGGLNGAKDSVMLMITLVATMGFFNGLIKIAQKSGLYDKIVNFLIKPVSLIFKNEKIDVKKAISMNVSANLLGMGNAATPLGIDAMKKMQENNTKKRKATDNMCLFAVVNTASIQIIPTTILAIRMKYNSNMPFIVVVPIWISSFLGLLSGIIACKIIEKRNKL